jgi:hypothetical protein
VGLHSHLLHLHTGDAVVLSNVLSGHAHGHVGADIVLLQPLVAALAVVGGEDTDAIALTRLNAE